MVMVGVFYEVGFWVVVLGYYIDEGFVGVVCFEGCLYLI